MMLSAGTAGFLSQRSELTAQERVAERKEVEESEQLNDQQRTFCSFPCGCTGESKAFQVTSHT